MFLEESIRRAITDTWAEVRADTVSCFGDGSALQVQRRQARLCLVTVAGTTVEAGISCVQILLCKVKVLLHKTSENLCKTPQDGAKDSQYYRWCLRNGQ